MLRAQLSSRHQDASSALSRAGGSGLNMPLASEIMLAVSGLGALASHSNVDTTQSLQGGSVTVGSPTAGVLTPYGCIDTLDILLNEKSKLAIQNAATSMAVDSTPTVVFTRLSTSQNGLGKASSFAEGAIALTNEQVSQLTALAMQGGGDVSFVVAPVVHGISQLENQIAIPDQETCTERECGPVPMKDDNGDDIEFEDEAESSELNQNGLIVSKEITQVPAAYRCISCSQVFSTKLDCKSHCSSVHGQVSNGFVLTTSAEKFSSFKGELKYKCEDCGRLYVTKPALKKHCLLLHRRNVDAPLQKATSKCIHPGCEKTFYHRQKMLDHLRDVHNVKCVQEDLVFNSWDDFLVWKEKEEDANFVHFSKNSTHTNAKNYMLANFTCQREGKSGYKYKGGQQKKYKDLVIGEKLCPARMRARLDKPTGRVTVQYCKSHNHKLSFQDFLYRRMPDWLRTEIREKLATGMSSEEIYKEFKSSENVRESRGDRFAPSKRQFVTLVNIKTLAKRMQIKETGGKFLALDPDPVTIQVQKLLDETYNPVLLYKDQGSSVELGPHEIDQIAASKDLLLIGIQTREQREMFEKHASKIVFIDITDSLISTQLYVVTVKVLDEYHKGYPVAFLITNSRDDAIFVYFFSEMRKRVSIDNLTISAVMTENAFNEFYAFRSVFGASIQHVLCKWNLHRAWCQKIHEECPGDESLQQELYFIFVTMLEERSSSKFECIATEFIHNYQTRCPNFISYFLSNYLSQSDVWASCHRNVEFSDFDHVLYADRMYDRIKRESKNGARPRSADDLLDIILKLEHEDYFNRGLNLMLNPVEPDLLLPEHDQGLSIPNCSVIDTHAADNRWIVKTMKKNPADLQVIKEESFVVTLKSDACTRDFCRERCLKLECFGLCSHLYHCSCNGETITPCQHVHKVHSMRIGVIQCRNEPQDSLSRSSQANTSTGDHLVVSGNTVDTLEASDHVDEPKLTLINQAHSKAAGDPDENRLEKMKQIKSHLRALSCYLNSDNIQRYSLDFIDSRLQSIMEECKVIYSIGQQAEASSKKRKLIHVEIPGAGPLVEKKSKLLSISSPVCVEIEPDLSLYSTFRKRATGNHLETPEDRMLKLALSSMANVNIQPNPKFRGNQSQLVMCSSDVIMAKEAEPISDDIEYDVPVPSQPLPEDDCDWTPNSVRRGRSRSTKRYKHIKACRGRSRMGSQLHLPALQSVNDIYQGLITNGEHVLSLAHIKSLQSKMSDDELLSIEEGMPSFFPGRLHESILNSFLYQLEANGENCLYVSTTKARSLLSGEPCLEKFWDTNVFGNENRQRIILVPSELREADHWVLFAVDTKLKTIAFVDPLRSANEPVCDIVRAAHKALIAFITMEMALHADDAQHAWLLTTPAHSANVSIGDSAVAILWYALLYRNEMSLEEPLITENVRKIIYQEVVGTCLEHVIAGQLNLCNLCKLQEGAMIDCNRCHQSYHVDCVRSRMPRSHFLCPT